MKLIFMGTPDFAADILNALIGSRHTVALAVTQPDKPKGRSKELVPSAVKSLALENGIPVFQPAKLRTEETLAELAGYHADAIIVAAYGKIIPPEILNLPEYGCINVHASLLPKYRGAAPIQWAVLNGESVSGVTIMQMNEGLDTGDILAVKEIPLDPKETGDSLFMRLSVLGAPLLLETLDKIEAGEIIPVPQPEESPTPYARMIRKADGRIDWSRPAAEIERQVRGMNSWPGAYTFYRNRNVKIWDSEVLEQDGEKDPGTFLCADQQALAVQTGNGILKILELQLEGKKRMRWDEFLRGCRWEAGTGFDA